MIQSKESDQKRLVKNTIFLFLRTILTTLISLYTSRVVLKVIGIDDYGIYNVVGGIVVMFSIVSASMTNTISRYITYEIGKKENSIVKVFSTSLNIQFIFSSVILVLSETIGFWFLNEHMNIQPERLTAANWVFQCSIVTFIINLISVPYNALIIAHERMKTFAYIGLLESVLKLVIVYVLISYGGDRLIMYAILIVGVSVLIRIIYGIYCKVQFTEIRYALIFDKKLIIEMSSFAGWYLFGTTAYLFNTQGVNIVSNIYFGVAVNAARGITTQVDTAIKQFVNNFTTALNPQIIKSYAEGKTDYSYQLTCKGAKYSVFLMLLFLVPFIIEADTILSLWLGTVPEYTVAFLRLALWVSLADMPGYALTILALGTGNVKKYYLCVGAFGCLVFPISLLLFYLGARPEASYVVYIIDNVLLVFVRLFLLRDIIHISVRYYLNYVMRSIIPVTVLVFVLPLAVTFIMQPSFMRLILTGLVATFSSLFIIYHVGMNKEERTMALVTIKKKIHKK